MTRIINTEAGVRGEDKPKPEELTWSGLSEKMASTRDEEYAAELWVEKLWRSAISFAAFAFAFVGIPLGVYTRPKGKATGFGISFLMILFYYFMIKYGMAVGETAHPLVGAAAVWTPNLVLAALGGVLMWRTIRL
jgi:lipopolysaccharide export LptBFGC system permease protein LptF